MLARKEEREAEEAYEGILDSLDTSEAGERLERMMKINDFVENLKHKRDDEGNLLMELPDDYEEMLETAIEYRKINNKDPEVSWVQVYQARKEHEIIDEEYKKRREKIVELDLVLKEKEKALRALKSGRSSAKGSKTDENAEKDSFFLTKVQTRSVKKPKVYSEQNFIKKNIEYAEEVRLGSMMDRLSDKERLRLAEIEDSIGQKEVPTDIFVPGELERLEEIDQRLRSYLPQIEWESKSVSSKSSNQAKKTKLKPGDPVLREAQERREVFTEMNNINSKLLDLQNRPVKPMHQDDINVTFT